MIQAPRQCVILVGGLGTRLGTLTTERPKPLLPVGGRPFVHYLLWHARRFGFERALLLAGYKADVLIDELDALKVDGLATEVMVESEPLGTGGAIRAAWDRLDDQFMLLNGDSIFDFNWLSLMDLMRTAPFDVAMSLRAVEDASRFGVAMLEGDRVSAFHERGGARSALINGGVYMVRRSALGDFAGKPMLRDVFRDLHRTMNEADERWFGDTPGLRVEIGAGVAAMRNSYPDVLATDVVAGTGVDRVLDAQQMDLEEGSVRAIFAQNAFHHLPEPRRFFAELQRVIRPGGGAVLIEPFHGPLASLLYPRLFRTEGFDKSAAAWETPMDGPMSGANQALSYLVFGRDRGVFQAEFPKLTVVATRPLTSAIRYVMSGGLNFRQLAPDWSIDAIRAMERSLSPLAPIWALHHLIVLRRET